jgi:hypothetical protein
MSGQSGLLKPAWHGSADYSGFQRSGFSIKGAAIADTNPHRFLAVLNQQKNRIVDARQLKSP